MTQAPTPTGRFCRHCGYDLTTAASPVCTECGRGFDPADPRTFDPSARSRARRRWRRRGLAAAAALVLLGVVAPRGHVTSAVTMTCPTCGLDRTVEGTRPVAAAWLPWSYPMVTRATERAPSSAPPPGCTHGVSFSFSLSKRLYTLRGVHSGGGLTASSGPTGGGTGLVNDLPVTGDSAVEVMRAISRDVASGGSFGVRVVGAGGIRSSTAVSTPASRRRRGGIVTDMDLRTSPNPSR